jgi:hypothetical protein
VVKSEEWISPPFGKVSTLCAICHQPLGMVNISDTYTMGYGMHTSCFELTTANATSFPMARDAVKKAVQR